MTHKRTRGERDLMRVVAALEPLTAADVVALYAVGLVKKGWLANGAGGNTGIGITADGNDAIRAFDKGDGQ